jgi:nicotinamidase-related amidase
MRRDEHTIGVQDRFYNTDLDKVLKAKGVTMIILVG